MLDTSILMWMALNKHMQETKNEQLPIGANEVRARADVVATKLHIILLFLFDPAPASWI